jgi:hypothetical protein
MNSIKRWLAAVLLAAGTVAAAPPPAELSGTVMGMSELPAAVQDTLLRESGGAGVGPIRKQRDRDGRAVYVTRISRSGAVVRVAPDGRLFTTER